MNIFLIPSWYPTKNNPISGVFTKEQSLMISENSEITYFVSIVEQYPISPKIFRKSFENLLHCFQAKTTTKVISNRFIEHRESVLSWTALLFKGNFSSLLHKHKKYLKELLGINKIDIIHAHVSYPAGYIAYLLSKEFDIPYIITEHMSPFPFPKYIKDKKIINELNISLYNASKIIAVSEDLKKDIEQYGFKNIEVIPNFIDETRYTIGDKIQNSKFTFLTVGGMSEQKGIDTLLYAISLVQDEISSIEFRIVGDGIKLEEYKGLSKKLGIDYLVKFLGQKNRDETVKEFQNCDVFILPSRHESFGIVYIEALACGKPIVATKCGGPEFIVNSNNGLLVEIDNQEELAKAILDMHKNYKQYDKEKIREEFINKFSKCSNIVHYSNVYSEVMKCVE